MPGKREEFYQRILQQNSGYETDTPDEVQQEAVRRVCGALGLREQYDAAVAAGELLELLESLPGGASRPPSGRCGVTSARASGPGPSYLALPRSAADRVEAHQMSGQMNR